MTNAEWDGWSSAHIVATGGRENQLREFLDANREIFENLGATAVELGECTERINSRGEIPNWPYEHANALVRELKALRSERQRAKARETFAQRYRAVGHVDGCDCPQCNGGKKLPSYAEAEKELKAYIGAATGKKRRAKR